METLELDDYDNEFVNLEATESTLNVIYEQILEVGVCKGTIEILNYLTEDNNPKYPIASFTKVPSNLNSHIALESIVDKILETLASIIKFTFNMLANFFQKLADLFRWLAGSDNKEVNTREDAVIKAMLTGQGEVKNNTIQFINKINDKPVKAIVTEKLLEMAYMDNYNNKYKNIKDILEEFFKKGIDEITWDKFLTNNNLKLKHLCDYILIWWNSSNPIVVSSEALVDRFVRDILDISEYISADITNRIKEYVKGIKDLSTKRDKEFMDGINSLSIKMNLSINDIKEKIINDVNSTFGLTPFVKTLVTQDIKSSLTNCLNEFKEAKVKPKEKIDLINSLKHIQWVKEIKDLMNKIDSGNKDLLNSERTLNFVIKNIKAKFFKSNKIVVDEISNLLNIMRTDVKELMTINATLLTFLLIIQKNIQLNRKKSSTMHELLIALGVSLEKEIKN